MELTCKYCPSSQTYKNKYNLIKHLQRTHSDKALDLVMDLKKRNIKTEKCPCGEYFSSVSNLNNHYKKCNKYLSHNIILMINQLETADELNEVYQYVSEARSKLLGKSDEKPLISAQNISLTSNDTSSCNMNVIGQTNNNINNNITVMNLGFENSTPIEEEQFIHALLEEEEDLTNPENLSSILTKLFKQTQLNNEYPENHNLYVSNNKPYKPYHVYKDDKWNKETMKRFDKMINIVENYLEQIYDVIELSYNNGDINYLKRRRLRDQVKACLDTHRERLVKDTAKKYFEESYKNREIIKETYDTTSNNL